MKDKGEDELTQQRFDRLLAWLDKNDRNRAGEKYEFIRGKLFRLFAARGFIEVERLTDMTFDRMAQILEKSSDEPPEAFIYGVAKNIAHEARRDPELIKKEQLDDNLVAHLKGHSLELQVNIGSDSSEMPVWKDDGAGECLDECLNRLSLYEKIFLIIYFHKGKQGDQKKNRMNMAIWLGITLKALHERAARMRKRVNKCVTECVEQRRRS